MTFFMPFLRRKNFVLRIIFETDFCFEKLVYDLATEKFCDSSCRV